MTDRKMEEHPRSACSEDLTKAALTHEAQLEAMAVSLIDRLEEVNREGVERFSVPQAAASEVVIRTRTDLKMI